MEFDAARFAQRPALRPFLAMPSARCVVHARNLKRVKIHDLWCRDWAPIGNTSAAYSRKLGGIISPSCQGWSSLFCLSLDFKLLSTFHYGIEEILRCLLENYYVESVLLSKPVEHDPLMPLFAASLLRASLTPATTDWKLR